MKLIDLRQLVNNKVSPKYVGVPQPMYVYHSTKELMDNIGDNYIILNNFQDFFNFVTERKIADTHIFTEVIKLNVWIATGENFIPDTFTQDDVLLIKLDDVGHAIKTDNCYIRLYCLYSAKNSFYLYTSSGVFAVSITKWNLSAGIKTQFIRVNNRNPYNLSGKHYEDRIAKYLTKKKTMVRDVRVFYTLFSPTSPYFGKPEQAVKAVFGNEIRKKDRLKILQTERFNKVFLKEMSILMPGLQQAFKDNIKDKDMVDMTLKIFEKAQKDGTIDDNIKVFDMIYQLREVDPNENKDNSGGFSMIGDGKVGNNQSKGKIGEKEEKLPELEFYNDDDIKNKPLRELKPELTEKEKEAEEEAREQAREDVGAVSDYVQDQKLKDM